MFRLPTIHREAEVLTAFCKPEKTVWDWSDVIYKNHPGLKDILKGKSPRRFYTYTHIYASKFIKRHKKELEQLVARYQKEWDTINDSYLKIISNHLETDYPKNKKIITAYVSIVPIFPRFLDEWAFNVSSKNTKSMIPISMHEILHFLYFKKWMEVFPKTKLRELDAPYLVWRLSEILDPIILDNNSDIQRLLKQKHNHYPEFRNVKIGKKTIVKHFEDLYKRHLKSKKSFGEFLKVSWVEAVKHRKVIENI